MISSLTRIYIVATWVAITYIVNKMQSLPLKLVNKLNRPRERLVANGAKSLSDIELLAIILRTGTAEQSVLELAKMLLIKFKNLENIFKSNIERLEKIKNIGLSKATTIKAILEISQRLNTTRVITNKIVKSPKDVFKITHPKFYKLEKENLFVVSLDTKSRLLGIDLVSSGTICKTYVPLREIFENAMLKSASQIILVHNHPSNDPTPSADDLIATEEVAKVGNKLEIPLIDHVICTNENYVSIKSLGVFETYKFNR